MNIIPHDTRYFATFIAGAMALEREGNDLAALKHWITELLGQYPSPDRVSIRDEQEDKEIFREENP